MKKKFTPLLLIILPALCNRKYCKNKFKSLLAFLFFFFALQDVCFAQPTVLGTDIVNGGYVTYDLNTVGGFKQYRIQALNNGVSGALQCQFASGTAAVTNYTLNWRPYSGSCSGFSNVQISGYNNFIPPNISFPATTATATYNSTGGGCPGFLPVVTAGNYYTFNVTNNPAANNNMGVLETTYNPETITSVTQSPATVGAVVSPTITVTMSSAPASNVYVRYSTNAGFITSTIVQLSFVGATGTATIPAQAAGTTVYYYVYSSTRTKAAIDADVTTYGQSVHDMATLNLNNNAGANYSYLVLPVTVNATNSAADASYATLKAAFDAINLGTHTGVINVTIGGNTTEVASAVLNGGAYTSVTIKPSGIRTVTGNLAAPLVDLNSADNVTIDGLNDGTNTLTFTNTSIAAAGTSTIRMYNAATVNAVQNCNIEGSTTSPTDGIVTLGSGTNTTISISNNNIRPAGANLPIYGVYSSGTNTSVTVSTNNIQDYYGATVNAAGVYANTSCNTWTISNNRFYQSASRTITGSAINARAIWVTAGGGHTISGNTIGFANSAGTGTTTYSTTNTNNQVIPIELAGNTIASSIQGNIISAFVITSASNLTSTTPAGVFSGIYVSSGAANIGTIAGNTIGATTGTGSISITCSATAGAPLLFVSGIYATAASPNTVNIQNNNAGSMNLVAASGPVQYQFYGIYVPATATAAYTIANNQMGSTTTLNSIVVGISSTSITNFVGIASGTTGTVSTPGNTIQNCTVSGTGASSFLGISVANSTGVLSITNNNIISCSNAGALTFIPISNTSVVTTLNISDNIIRSNTISSGTCAFTGILNSGAATSAININNNQLGNASGGLITFSVANNAAFFGINNAGGASSAALTIQANDFRGITNTGSGAQTYISNTAATLSQNINTNTFTALSISTTGNVTFISNSVTLGATGTKIIKDNAIVTSFTKTGGGGTNLYFYYDIGSSVAGATITNEGNNFSNVTINGATTCQGWFNTDGSGTVPVKNIFNNTFNNIVANTSGVFPIQVTNGTGSIYGNTITNCSAPNTVTGLSVTSGSYNIYSNTINTLSSSGSFAGVTGVNISGGTTYNIYNQTIYNLTSSATSTTISGVTVGSGTSVSVYKNKIYGLSNSAALGSGGVYGVSVTGGTTVNVYNNLIGTLTAPAANVDDVIRGISIGGGTTVNVYYNTVYLTASGGANFGSSALFANTTPTLDLRNNILINNSTPGASGGKTVAYRRSNATLGTYAATSNNNLFYRTLPAAANSLIYYDGTNSDQTLVAFQTRVTPRDNVSVTALLTFISTTGSSANFLHCNTSNAAESAGANIAGFTDDYDGDIRFGNVGYLGTSTTGTDIGADEFESVVCPATPTVTGISSAAPYYAGDIITITGTNLSGITYATIGGINVSASITGTTATSANLTIPVTLSDSTALIQVAYTGSCTYSIPYSFAFAGYITKGAGTGSGTWSTASIWRNNAIPVPNSPATINTGDAVTLNISADPIKFTINTTATFTHATSNSNVFGTTYLNNTTVNGSLVIDDAVTPILVSASRFISPKLMVNNGGIFTNNSATAAAVTITNFYVYAGGTYNHNAVGSVANGVTNDFPGSTLRSYGNTSNVVITKWGNSGVGPVALPASGSPGWGNITINVASLGGSWNQAGTLNNVQGNMLVLATGGSTNQFQLMNGGSGTVSTTIAGNLTVSGGSFACANGSSVNYTTNVTGNLLVDGTGTVFQVSRGSIASDVLNVTGSATIAGTAAFSNTGTTGNAVTPGVVMNFSSLDVNSGTFTPSISSSCYSAVNVTGAFTVTGGAVNNGSGVQYKYTAGSLTVSSGSFSPGGSNSALFDMSVTGNFTVSGTGSFASASNGNKLITIGGDFIQSSTSATAFQMQGSTSTAGRIYKLSIGGNFTMTNGIFIGGSSLSPDSIIFNGGLATINYTQNGGSSYAISSPANSRSDFAVYSGKTVNMLNSFVPASTGASNKNSFTVYSGGVLTCGASSEIGGANAYTSFMLNSGGTIQTAHIGGVFNTTAAAASITTAAANASLSSGATYVFNGVAPQVSSAFATTPTLSTVANMVINNSAGVTLSASYNVTAALQMQTGNLTLSTFNLTTATITGSPFSNTKMVVTNSTGALGQPVALATILYPVGNSGNYTPASYTFTANSTARYLNVRAVTPRNVNDVTATNYINNRWWNTDLSVTTGTYTYTASYTFILADIVGAAASIRLNRWNGSAWISDAASSITGNVLNSGTLTEATGTLSATAEWVGRVYVAPAIYHWTNTVNGLWTDPTKWTPIGVPGSGDGVIFDAAGGVPYVVTNMPTTLSLTQMTVSNNNVFSLNASGTSTVNMIFPGTATPQLSVASGSAMTIDGTNVVTINLPASATGNIAGSLNLQKTTHKVLVTTAGALVIPSGGYFSYGSTSNTGYTGNPFGATGTTGAVIFQSGSICECFEGSNPFGATATDKITTFLTNSLFRYSDIGVATLPSASGRTYANFTYNANKTANMAAAANSFICDSLTVTVGTINFNLQGTPTPDHAVRGNINVLSGATLSFSPSVAGTVNMNSGATQIIWGAGIFNVNALATFDINAGTTASLQKNMGVNSTGNVVVNGTAILTGENYINTPTTAGGTVTLNNGGTLSIQSVDGISNTGVGNIRSTNFTYNSGGNFTYSGTANQVTGNRLPLTLSGAPLSTLTIANTGTAPNNIVTLTTNNTSTAKIILASGQFNAGTGGTLIINNGTNLVVGTGGNQYLSGTATDNIIRFAANGAVQGTPELWNVTIGTSGTGVDFTNNARINGILLINSGGFVNPNAPKYNTGSFLIYNTTGSYNRALEWSNNTGLGTPGYPHHVTIQNGTTVDLLNPAFDIGCGGNLTLGTATAGAGTLVLSSYTQPYDLFVKGNINIGSTAAGTLTMSNSVGCDLYLTGNWVRNANGIVNFGGGNGRSVYFEGSTDATITATNGQYFPYLRLQKSAKATKVTLADHVSIGFEATFTKGTLDLGTNNKFFSLLSNVNYDARVDVSDSANTAFVYGTDDINGLFIVHRYFPAQRKWRLLNAPLKAGGGTHTISQAWQERGNAGTGLDYTAANWVASVATDTAGANFATQITGGTTANGFDLSPNNSPSIKSYSGGTWTVPANTNAVGVNSVEGWLLFVRGDRETYGEITNNLKTPTITSLRPRGQIFIGQKTITASGMQTVGNPYASAVDYFAMSRTGAGVWPANPTYYVWDPSLGGSAGVGAFVALTWNGTNFTRISTGYGTGNYDNRYISSGAAIMVDFPAAGGTLSMNEANKNTDSNTTAFRPVRQLQTLLQTKDTDNSFYVADGALSLFDNSFNMAADLNDARKLSNINENIALQRNGSILSIERMKLTGEADTVFYFMSRLQRKNYQLQLTLNDMQLPHSTTAFLEDTYLKRKTPVRLEGITEIGFAVTTDAGSSATDRFRLVFRRSVKYTSVNAVVLNSDVAINWNVSDELNIEQYEIERSVDGTHFNLIATRLSNGESGVPVSYEGLDASPLPGEYYYRIKSISKFGVVAYSDIVKVKVVKVSPALYVFPNPVTNSIIQLQLNNAIAGVYSTSLYGSNGQAINSETINHAGGTATKTIQPKQKLTNGTYQLQVTGPDGKVTVIKVVVTNE